MSNFRAELVELINKRNALAIRITQISHAMEAMARTCEDVLKKAEYLDDIRNLTAQVGFQEAIRITLAFNRNGMTAPEIRRYIWEKQLMDLVNYSNPLASIHTTLRRMKENSEVEEIDKAGDKAYRLMPKQTEQPGLRMAARTRARRWRGDTTKDIK